MEEGSLQPPITHLLHVTPSSNEKPAKGFSWGDYEDVHDPVSSSLCQHTIDRETSADADDDDDGRFVKNSYRQTSMYSPSLFLLSQLRLNQLYFFHRIRPHDLL